MAYTVQDALAARKKKKEEEEKNKTKISVEDALERRKQRITSNMSSITEDFNTRYKSVIDTYNMYYNGSEKFKWGGNYSTLLKNQKARESEVSTLKNDIEAYRKYLGDDIADKFVTSLDEVSSAYKGISSKAQLYSQFGSEAEYNDAVKLNELYSMPTDTLAYYHWREGRVLREEGLKNEKAKLEASLSDKSKSAEEIAQAKQRIAEINKELPVIGDAIKNGDIAYTTSSGQNITWKSLYEQKKAEENHLAIYNPIKNSSDFETSVQKAKDSEIPTLDDLTYDFSIDLGFTELGVGKNHPGQYNKVSFVENHWSEIATREAEFKEDFEAPSYLIHMTDEEKDIYNYYYGRGEYDKADEYLASLDETLKGREEGRLLGVYKDMAEDLPVLSSIVSIFSSMASGAEYIADTYNYLKTGELDDNHMANVTTTIRGTVAEQVDWEIGNWDAFDFVYNAGMSMADSAASMYTLGSGGGIALGLSAAAQGTNDALNRGMSSKDAFWNGFFSGVFEGLFESISIGNLNALKEVPESTFKGMAKNIGKAMLVNASEEAATEVANIAYDTLVNADFSQAMTDVRAYQAAGMSEEDAVKKVAWGLIGQVAESAASGALMGLGMGGAGQAQAYVGDRLSIGQEIIDYKGYDDLKALAMSVSQEAAGVKALDKAVAKADKKTSAWNVGGLSLKVDAVRVQQNVADVQAALVEKGMSEKEAKKYAQKLVDISENLYWGAELTQDEVDFIESNEIVNEVYTSLLSDPGSSVNSRNLMHDNTREGIVTNEDGTVTYSESAVNRVKERAAQEKAFGKSPVESRYKANTGIADEADEVVPMSEDQAAEYKGKTTYSNPETGEVKTVEIQGISSIKKGEMMLKLDNGEVVNADSVRFASEGDALVYSAMVDMGVNAGVAEALVNEFKASGVDGNVFSLGFRDAYTYGELGIDLSQLPENSFAHYLPEGQRNYIHQLGATNRTADVDAEQSAIDSAMADAKPKPANKPSSKKNKKKNKGKSAVAKSKTSDKIIVEDGVVTDENGEIDESALTDVQKANLVGIKALAKLSPINFHVFRSSIVNGKYVATINGKLVEGSPNGVYFAGTNDIWIDLNAGDKGEGTMLWTASHEISHYIRERSPAKWKVMADFLMEEYSKNKDVSVSELLDRQKAKVMESEDSSDMTELEIADMAFEELVSDALSDMLTDGTVVEFLAEVKQKDMNLWRTIKKAVTDLLKRWGEVLGVYEGRTPDAVEAQALRGMEDAFKKLQQMFAEAFAEANAVEEAQAYLNKNGISTVTDGKQEAASLNSVRNLLNDDQKKKAAAALAVRFDVTEAEAMEWLKAETSLASLILNPKYSQFLDYEADASEDAIKKNSDYPQGTVDFSNICKKRRAFTEVMGRVLRNFPNHVFMATDLAKIRTIMSEEGMEVACAICYVEDRRQLDSIVAQDFIDSLELYRSGSKTRPDGKAFNANQLKALRLIDGDSYIPSIYELVSLEGRNELKAKNPAMEEAWVKFNNARGMQSVRLLTNEAEYTRQILDYTAKTVQSKNDHGGLRIYSFSDMEMFHLIDVIQVITDSSVVGLMIQGYTKVNEYAKAVRNTREKLNRSLIPLGELGYHIEDGKVVLDFDTVEGIDINHPDFFDNSDNPDVGNIVIGINNRQIRAAMVSPFIDQIIPFHTGQSAEVLGEKGIATWDNYKDYQSERDLSTGTKSAHQINIYTEVIQAAEKEGKPIRNKVDFVNKFLEVCKANGLEPRFSQFLNTDENGDYVYTEGYHKFLVDFKTFDQRTGEYLPQMPVKPIFYEEYITGLLRDYAKSQKQKDAELAESMPRVIDRITDEVVTPAEKPEAKFSLRGKTADGVEVYETSKAVLNMPWKKRKELYLSFIEDDYVGRTAKFVRNGHTYYAEFDRKNAKKAIYGDRRSDVAGRDALINTGADGSVFELIENATYDRSGKDRKSHSSTDYFDYFIKTVQIDGKVFDLLADVKKQYNKDGGFVYTIRLVENKKIKASPIQRGKSLLKNSGNASNGSIPQNPNSVKSKNSQRNSNGEMLSEGQQEYFRDSKVRDSKGRLLILYHGTDSDITVFNASYSQDGISLFLTDSKYVASTYTTSDKVMPLYANLVNPLIVDAKGKDSYHIPVPKELEYMQLGKTVEARQLAYYAKGMGHDGVIIKNVVDVAGFATPRKATDVIAFNAEQIKYISNNAPTNDPDIRYSQRNKAPTFYSHMGRVIDGIKAEKVGAGGVVPYLKGKGVKNDEIKWSGIEAFLEGKKSVTKAELQEFIAGSMLQIGEQMSSNDIDLRYDSSSHSYSLYDQDGNIVDTFTYNDFVGGYVSDTTDEIYSNAVELEDALREEYGSMSSPRWADFTLGGGTSYREIVFTMPDSSYTNKMMQVHWGDDAEGVLAHARIQDFVVDGKRMLFVEEIQSDWHNEGHSEGYRDDAKLKELQELEAKASEAFYALEDYSTELTGNAGEYEAVAKTQKGRELLRAKIKTEKALKQAQAEYDTKVPDAPFRDTYHEYVMKRLIRMAAEEGYDSIGWTPADVQVKRWSEEFAEGYRIEYDQDIPKFMSKFGKKWGAKVGKTVLGDYKLQVDVDSQTSIDDDAWLLADGIQAKGEEVWSMPITEAMKESVLYEGQALYQERNTDSNRALLADALESVAETPEDKNALKNYRKKIRSMEADQQRLSEVNAEIRELSFAKGKRDAKRLKELRFEAVQLANRINTYDRQLLRLESTGVLKQVLDREKGLARKRQKQKDAEAMKKYREEARAKAEADRKKLVEQHQESRRKATEGRNKTEMRGKIKKIVSELNDLLLNGSKDNHVMIGLQKAVAMALDAVNMDTVGAEERVAKYNELIAKATDPDVIASLTETRDRIQGMGDKMSDRFTALKNAYDEIKNSTDPLIANSHDEVIVARLEYIAAKVGDTSLRDMTLEQLEDVYDMYKMVLTTIRNANKAFHAEKAESIATLGNNVMQEIEQAGGSKTHVLGGKLGAALSTVKSFDWNNLKPVFFFTRLGSKTFSKLFENVRKGEDTWAVDITEAKEFKEAVAKKYGYDSWDFKKVYTFKSSTGKEFTLTLEQMMSLYAYSKREQALPHLAEGGFVFDQAIETYKEKEDGKKSKLKYRVNTATAYKISEAEVNKVIAELSQIPGVKEFVDEMQDYLSTVMGAKGNEVSLAMYGVKLFKEKFYFPLKSAKQYMFEQNEVAGEVKIKNAGFSKQTVKHANNPVILSDFMDVWANHVNDMSMYHAFVLSLEDFNRVFNYRTPASESLDEESVKGFIQNAYESKAVQYISQLLKDLNGGARVDPRENAGRKLVGLFKKASVFASASVVIQQPSAVARALSEIDAKYFDFNPKIISHSKHWAELKKYAPVAVIKEMGHFDTDMGMSSVDYIRGDKSIMDKVDDAISKPAAYMDELTWVHIWTAVKREVMAQNKGITGEELLQKAGERFTEVISKTQVYDSVLSRSANMRSKSMFMNMLTSFMAEPTTSINMLEDAVTSFSRGDKKGASREIASVAASVVLNSLLVSLVYAMRDEDEDETFGEKYLESLTTELLDGFNLLTYYPIVKDIWSIAQGYEVQRSDMTLIDKAVSSLRDIITAYSEDTDGMTEDELEEHDRKIMDAWIGVAGDLSSLVGLPVKNIIRDVKAVFNVVETAGRSQDTSGAILRDTVTEAAKNTTPVVGWLPDDSKTDKLYDAIMSDDKVYISRLKSGYKSESAYINAVSKALRENDPRIREAAEARLSGDMTRYKQIALEIKGEGHFSQDVIVRAINSEMNALDKGDSSSGVTAKPMYTYADFYKAAIGGDSADVNAVKEYLIESGKTESAIESSFNTSVKNAYEEGEIDSFKAISLMVEYGGKTSDEADISVRYIDFKAEYPGYADSVTEAKFAKYYEPIEDYGNYSLDDMGISLDAYAEYCDKTKGIKGVDYDGDGKTDSGSKKALVMQVIDGLPLTSSQKDALYYFNGWSYSTLYEAPWR